MYLEKMRNSPVSHNPYYEFFRDSVGKGNNEYYSGIGDIYSSVPEFKRGYGVLTRGSMYGTRPQLGYGWKDIFSNLFRFAKPLLKRGLKEAVKVATNVASDAIEGENVKSSLKKHIKSTSTELLPSAFSGIINNAIGSGGVSSYSGIAARGGKRKRSVVQHKKAKKKKRVLSYPALQYIA